MSDEIVVAQESSSGVQSARSKTFFENKAKSKKRVRNAQAYTIEALRFLADQMHSSQVSNSDKIKAASTILEYDKAVVKAEHEHQMQMLEKQLQHHEDLPKLSMSPEALKQEQDDEDAEDQEDKLKALGIDFGTIMEVDFNEE